MLSASKSGSGLATGYNLTRSLRFRASASAYLSKSYSASATNSNIQTISVWTKRGQLGIIPVLFMGYSNASNYCYYTFNSDDTLWFVYTVSGTQYILKTSQVFRDASAWYHLVFAYDSTQATAANRVKLYVNGVQITSFSAAAYPPQNNNSFLYTASGLTSSIGAFNGTSNWYDGYMVELNFIDGQALTPSSFGSTNALTGVWQPARYTGTYGTNGFYLPFTDNSALTTSSNVGLGKDFSGNGNYWTTNNISITAGVAYDSMTDVPTLTSATAANYCVYNPLNSYAGVLSAANLATYSATAAWFSSVGTIYVNSGKWYAEVTVTSRTQASAIGIANTTFSGLISQYVGISAGSYSYVSDGNKYNNSTAVAYGATYTNGDVIGIALDLTAGTLTFYKNNVSQGTAYTGLTGTFAFAVSVFQDQLYSNFGQFPFTYTPPTGFVALNTYNLPTSTILQGNKVMDATTYTGNSSTQNIVNGGAFKPDFVWMKNRTTTAISHYLNDSVRGAYKTLFSNLTNAEYDGTSNSDGVSTFNSNGFTVLNGTNALNYNQTSNNYVAWQWQAGQGSTLSNTNGSITSTVSVNASAGFSVVTYTGTGSGTPTIGHGLGVTPALIIGKNRSGSAQNWQVWHTSIGDNVLQLNLTNAQVASTANSVFIVAGINSSVFQVGTNPSLNGSATTQVAYCWTPIAGYSAFGSYTGNGSTDGTFVYTGFLPRWVMVKRTDTTGDWQILDTARGTYNPDDARLWADLSNAEVSNGNGNTDFLSNGFKFRNTNADNNASGGTYIYAAFASNPLKNSLAR